MRRLRRSPYRDFLVHADSRFSSVATGVIGDYYARFGTADDAIWLKDLPDLFPYPTSWKEDQRSQLRMALREESRRAIDAIRRAGIVCSR